MILQKQKQERVHQTMNQKQHVPVLLREVLEYLDPKPGKMYLDLTAGYGGHAQAIEAHTNGWPMVLVDRDQMAVSYLQQRFTAANTEIRWQDFLTASQDLLAEGRLFDMILADLGVSSPHLNTASRGFSHQQDGPLDMRMDQRQELTAETIVNTYGEQELSHILKEYGEEPKAKRIARAIVENRPFRTTTELAAVISKQWKGYSKVHPATRTFQALRIEVNNELHLLRHALPVWLKLLKPGGRLAIISFHSLEDREVKQVFKSFAGGYYDAELEILTKRPVVADNHEIVINPRSRSAKLRVAAKIKNKKKGRI